MNERLEPAGPVDKSGVGVLDKSMALLSCLEAGPASLNELVVATGVNRATAHRLLAALEAHGLVHRHDAGGGRGRYGLGARLASLAAARSAIPLVQAAQPVLDELRTVTEESAQLYVAEGRERVCVAVAESAHGLRTIVGVGERLSMELGSAARVLRGDIVAGEVAASIAERQAGVASVSAAVRDTAGTVVAAISVSGPIDRLGPNPAERHGEAVLAAAAVIETRVG